MQTLRHVVAGTDFSGHAESAIELAIELALAANARVTVVHVCELGADNLDDERLRQGGETLDRWVVERQRGGVDLMGVLRSGRPWEKLDNVAVEVGASLIVVGRRGAGRGLGTALGSVAEHLVRSASRPVLTVSNDFEAPGSEG